MDNKEEVLIEIVVSNEAATKAIFENQQSIERLKKSQDELNQSLKDGSITTEQYSKKSTAVKVAIDQQKESIRQNEKELRNNIKTNQDNNDSLSAMRAQLSNSVKAFDNLSKAERESSKGKDLQEGISKLVDELKGAEEATGRFQRNVGNYPESTNAASQGINRVTGFLGKMGEQLEGFGGISGEFGGFLGKMSSNIGEFAGKASEATESIGAINTAINQTGESATKIEGFAGKATENISSLSATSKVAGTTMSSAFSVITSAAKSMATVFLTPPVIIISAIVLAIVGAVKLMQKGFSLNGEASDKMKESMAALKPIMDIIGKLASFIAGAIADLVGFMAEGIATVIDFTTSLFGMQSGLSNAAKESMALAKAQNELETAEREFSVKNALRQVEKSKLLSEVSDKEKFTAERRIQLLKQALNLDKENLEESKKLAFENLRIIEETAKSEGDTSNETADKIAEARVKAANAVKDYFEGTKEINKKISEAEAEIDAQRKKSHDDYIKQRDEKLDKERKLVQQLEDLLVAQIKDDLQRQVASERIKTEHANEELKHRLDTEKNLTDTAKKAINDIIFVNEQDLQGKIIELTNKASEDEIKKEIDTQTKIIEAKLILIEKQSQEELNLQIARLEIKKQAELNNSELTGIEKLAIEEKFNQQEEELNNKFLIDKNNALKDHLDKEFEIKLLQSQNDGNLIDEKFALELQKAQEQNFALVNLDSKTKAALYKTQLDYEVAVADSQQKLIAAQDAVTDSQIRGAESVRDSLATISNSVSELSSSMAEDNYQAAQYAKAIALVNIGISLAVGIAGAVQAASKATTWVEMLAAIATGIAAVTSGISAANRALNATPAPKKPKFYTGGLISGSGTGTSDSIDARVSNGESIMNANSTSMFMPLLSALNQAGGGVGFGQNSVNNSVQGEDMLARAFAKGVSMLPAPVVSVKEITKTQERVTVLENLT